MSYAIRVEDLKKSYNSHIVLKGLNFNVNKGEIFALLGVNGTGKTTTLECIEGLRKYDSGNIVVNGKMGIQLQSTSLPEHMKAMEAVRLFAKWNKVEINHEMLDSLGVKELAKKQYLEMSTGQKRRLHLALALVRDPEIVFLDEPTSGLDVEGRKFLHQEIRKLKERGKTIIMASHDMVEVESLCDRIAILKDGDIAFIGTAEELTTKIGQRCTIYIKTEQGFESFESDNISDTILTQLEDYKCRGIAVLDIKIDRGTLEQHFINISRGINQ
ncbi:ABC transporter ATP-binding protein [Clostridiaceae bacterium M8S5]|nr:ABC transporter ATP-binding protein [Clostridiaceae bacterium M8S5]